MHLDAIWDFTREHADRNSGLYRHAVNMKRYTQRIVERFASNAAGYTSKQKVKFENERLPLKSFENVKVKEK
jgi:hypothetical protein